MDKKLLLLKERLFMVEINRVEINLDDNVPEDMAGVYRLVA